MSVDKELERAVQDAEAEVSVPAVEQSATPVASAPAKSKGRGSIGLLVALLAIVGGVVGLVFSFKDAAVYSVGVDKLMKERDRYGNRSVKVQGMLVKGTLVRRDEPCEYRFKIQQGDTVLPMRFAQCVVPDTFRDMPGMDVEVTADGKLAADGQSFEATLIMAKCPSKYEMKQKSMAGELAPHLGQQATPLETLSQKD
ncbi:MAG TPA: cytochrome c maturation protein CcmE [Polyangiaceae bacterium]